MNPFRSVSRLDEAPGPAETARHGVKRTLARRGPRRAQSNKRNRLKTKQVMHKQVLIALAVIAGIVVGCGKNTYKTKDGEVTVDRTGGKITIEGKSKEGTVTVTASQNGVALPDNFPKDVPIYKGAVVQVASTQGKTMLVHLNVDAAVADALKYYQAELKSQGWQIDSTMNMGDGSMLVAKKGHRQCSALVMKQEKGAMVQLSVTQEGS
jgi:hypothetical protein